VPVLSKGFGPTPALAPGRIPDSEPAALCTWSRVDGKVVPFDCGLVVSARWSPRKSSQMESSVRLCTPFTCGPLLRARRSGWASMSAPELTQRRAPPARAAAAGNKSIVAQWAEDAGLKTSVSLVDFLGDRCARNPYIACALCGNPFVLTQGVHQQVRRAVKLSCSSLRACSSAISLGPWTLCAGLRA